MEDASATIRKNLETVKRFLKGCNYQWAGFRATRYLAHGKTPQNSLLIAPRILLSNSKMSKSKYDRLRLAVRDSLSNQTGTLELRLPLKSETIFAVANKIN
jgi:hypothetical protein